MYTRHIPPNVSKLPPEAASAITEAFNLVEQRAKARLTKELPELEEEVKERFEEQWKEWFAHDGDNWKEEKADELKEKYVEEYEDEHGDEPDEVWLKQTDDAITQEVEVLLVSEKEKDFRQQLQAAKDNSYAEIFEEEFQAWKKEQAEASE
jgi:hypothetical protein